jgi:hypothetical protein
MRTMTSPRRTSTALTRGRRGITASEGRARQRLARYSARPHDVVATERHDSSTRARL